MTEQQLRQKYVGMAQTYLNAKEGSAAHKKIIDTYNSVLPHPRNYKMTYTAPWCAPFVSANAIMCDMLSIFAFECSCTKQIEIWKSKGRWIEDDAYRPQMGDIIYYDWNDSGKGDNTGLPDHVGIVVYCDGNDIKVIEGNKGNMVSYRTITVNGKNIRGFAVPDYASLADKDTQEENTMAETIYKDIKDVPEAWRGSIQKLLDADTINGGTIKEINATDVNLTKTEAKLCHIFVKYIDSVMDSVKTINADKKAVDTIAEKLLIRVRDAIDAAIEEG